MKKIWNWLKNNFKALFTNFFAPNDGNSLMFYYGTLIYVLANIFVSDLVTIIVVAIVIGLLLAYRKYMLHRKIYWLNFIFGLATTLFTSIQIWL